MKRFVAIVVGMALGLGLFPAVAGPTPGGMTSDKVEWVSFVPFDQSTSTGVSFWKKYMFLTSWKNISIYDVSNPTAPTLEGYAPVGFQFENEDVASNGKIMLFSESLPVDRLHVWDVEDKSNPVEIATVPGAGDHTTSCILDCKWSYGSSGAITDLRNPSKPKLFGKTWMQLTGFTGGVHDVSEYKRGHILVSGYGEMATIDATNPTKPKILTRTKNTNTAFIFHSGLWPRGGKDRWVLMQGEQNATQRCDDNTGPFQTFDTKGWQRTKQFKLKDTFRVSNGVMVDGSPPANGLGCSAHWFTYHPTFKNGGLVTMGYYEHGTRFFDVAKTGKIKEVGWFLPWGGSTSAAYWVPTDKKKKIVYAVDYTRGIDILRYNGKF
jgi:LVIVD repeat